MTEKMRVIRTVILLAFMDHVSPKNTKRRKATTQIDKLKYITSLVRYHFPTRRVKSEWMCPK
jgi:hypothetical protein